MFLPPGFNRKKNPSPNLSLLMARLYEFRFSIKCHTFRAVSVELCWLYSPRPSAWPWFILQKYTAGSLCFHQHSFPKNTAAQRGLDSKPITGLWCWIWWVVWCVVSPPHLSFFSLSLLERQSPSRGSGTKGWNSMMWLIRARSQNILCRLTVLLGREHPSA